MGLLPAFSIRNLIIIILTLLLYLSAAAFVKRILPATDHSPSLPPRYAVPRLRSFAFPCETAQILSQMGDSPRILSLLYMDKPFVLL